MIRWPFKRLSLALRIALSGALFGLIIVGAGSGVGYWALSRQLEARSTAELLGKRDLVVHVLSELPTTAAVPANKHRFADLLVGHDDVHLALAEARSRALLSGFSETAVESMAALDAAGRDGAPVTWRSNTGARMQSVAQEAPLADGTRIRFYVSLDTQQDRRLLHGFVQATLLGLPLLLGAVALGAWLIARTGLAPLRSFQHLAASIGTQSLGHRLSESGLPRELDELARELNAMLDRIDSGYRRLQEFSADLAHEMRTPIATLLGRSQVALSQQRSPDEMREVLEGNIEELERLSRLIADMLFIAQADHGQPLGRRELLSLEEEAVRVAEYLSLVAEEKQVDVRVSGSGAVMADRLLVQRAVTNLLSNAIRHAHASSSVEVAISRGQDGVVRMVVANVGESIPREHLGRIFDRFYRVDASRARMSGGTGLGLAIVRSIMLAHGGEVVASSDAATGRTAFTLQFPVAQEAVQAADESGFPPLRTSARS